MCAFSRSLNTEKNRPDLAVPISRFYSMITIRLGTLSPSAFPKHSLSVRAAGLNWIELDKIRPDQCGSVYNNMRPGFTGLSLPQDLGKGQNASADFKMLGMNCGQFCQKDVICTPWKSVGNCGYLATKTHSIRHSPSRQGFQIARTTRIIPTANIGRLTM